jgi:hypothetical protein
LSGAQGVNGDLALDAFDADNLSIAAYWIGLMRTI